MSTRSSGVTEIGPLPSPPRLGLIEGMRAYLALWVVVCHVMGATGYGSMDLSLLPSLFRDGGIPVKVFVIISAFVIFLLLDTKHMTYGQFLVRRFFRLFPLFIVLFLVAIPVSDLRLWNVTQATAYLSPEQIVHDASRFQSWMENWHWHVPLHVVMLHGTVPETLLRDSPAAFLGPAWSVSLEWQFYLVAPWLFGLAVSARPFRRIALCAGCVLLFYAALRFFPPVRYGAALPFHLDFFFLGGVSYFIYKQFPDGVRADTAFPIACSFAVFLALAGGSHRFQLIPIALWIALLGLLLEPRSSFSWQIASSFFTNRVAQYLGRISYSIYLSHILLMVCTQYALLKWAPGLSRLAHCWILLGLTTVATVVASIFLYRYLEAPGIWFGRVLSNRLGHSGARIRLATHRPTTKAELSRGQ